MNIIRQVNRLKIAASFVLLLSFLLTAPVFAGEAEKSPSHNKLILRGDYKRFGCAHYIDESGADYFVVLFSYYQ